MRLSIFLERSPIRVTRTTPTTTPRGTRILGEQADCETHARQSQTASSSFTLSGADVATPACVHSVRQRPKFREILLEVALLHLIDGVQQPDDTVRLASCRNSINRIVVRTERSILNVIVWTVPHATSWLAAAATSRNCRRFSSVQRQADSGEAAKLICIGLHLEFRGRRRESVVTSRVQDISRCQARIPVCLIIGAFSFPSAVLNWKGAAIFGSSCQPR